MSRSAWMLMMGLAACSGASPKTEAPAPAAVVVPESGDEGDVLLEAPITTSSALLAAMPASCDGRVHIHLAATLADQRARATLRELADKLVERKGSEVMKKAAAALAATDLDLATSVRELALCMHASDDPVVGASLAVDDPLALLDHLAAAFDERGPAIRDKGGARVAEVGDRVLVQPAEGVVIFAKSSRLTEILEQRGTPGFATARDHLAFLTTDIEGVHIEVKVDRVGENFDVTNTIGLPEELALAARRNPNQFLREVRGKVLAIGSSLQGTPFAFFEDRLHRAHFKLEGDTIIADLLVPTADLPALLHATAAQLDDPMAELSRELDR